MPISTAVAVQTTATSLVSGLHSNLSPWQTVISAGGVTIEDNSGNPITIPSTQITSSTRVPLLRQNSLGRYIQCRLVYDDGISVIVDSPEIVWFQRAAPTEAWSLMKNRAGNLAGELTIDQTNDVQDGTYGYTTVDSDRTTWEIAGGDEFLPGILTAIDATGTLSNARIEARII